MNKLAGKTAEQLRQISAEFVHDIRTPLAAIGAGARGFEKHWQPLIQGYELAVAAGLMKPCLNSFQIGALGKMMKRLAADSRTSHQLVNRYWEEVVRHIEVQEQDVQIDETQTLTTLAIREKSSPATDAPFRALLVDDHAVNREVAKEMLALLGCEVTEAHDGEEALVLWAEGGYQLVLMDFRLPRLDGLTATREIRARESSASGRTPIIGVSASPDQTEMAAAIASGMDLCIEKPLTVDKLMGVLDRYCTSKCNG